MEGKEEGGTAQGSKPEQPDWGVEEWYDAIKEFTFETRFVPLPMSAVEALLQAHTARSAGKTLAPDYAQVIDQLKNEVDEAIADLGGAAFVRISTLSPKDAVKWQTEKLKALLEKELEKVELHDEDGEIIAINMACCLACRMTSGEDALDLLIRSDRVDRHLSARKESEGDDLTVNIVVRKWLDFRPEMEFRGFVYNKQLTAVTHYYKFCYVREAVERKDAIAQKIRAFFEDHLREVIPSSTYVIDFALLPDDRLLVVELNPFAPNTSPGLFDWERDRDVLTGERPFEMRILETRVEGARDLLAAPLRFLLEMVRPKQSSDASDTNETKMKMKKKDHAKRDRCVLS